MTSMNETLAPAASRANVAAQLAGLATVLLWDSAFVAIRSAGETISPGALALERVLVSSVVLSGIALTWRMSQPQRRDLAPLVGETPSWMAVAGSALPR